MRAEAIELSSIFDKAKLILVLDKDSEETISFTLKAKPFAAFDGFESLNFQADSPPEYRTVSLSTVNFVIRPDGGTIPF